MPIYEFYSPDTNRIYSFFARSLAQGRLTPRCPDKPGARMERLVSRFAVTGRARETPQVGNGPEADPRMERVMAEMEREMGAMGDSEPDPRALARMMRKMTEATGQKVPGEMEQMLRRLEAGEDPEKLEEEFGEALDHMDLPDDEKPGSDEATTGRKRQRRPTRDPVLYEMADFV
ncbi:MAG: hypothetical protein SFU53_05045 [Terrimicrobiaceae bacterium]|nr:hypothetical protein [Terrimicrobiaceae bacterium]